MSDENQAQPDPDHDERRLALEREIKKRAADTSTPLNLNGLLTPDQAIRLIGSAPRAPKRNKRPRTH